MDGKETESQLWQTRFPPPAGGWNRLSAKFIKAQERHDHEIRIWRTAAVMMLALIPLAAFQNSPEAESVIASAKATSTNEVSVDEGHATQVPGTPNGVRFYWVFPK